MSSWRNAIAMGLGMLHRRPPCVASDQQIIAMRSERKSMGRVRSHTTVKSDQNPDLAEAQEGWFTNQVVVHCHLERVSSERSIALQGAVPLAA
jgi:hypothetical protein